MTRNDRFLHDGLLSWFWPECEIAVYSCKRHAFKAIWRSGTDVSEVQNV